MLHAIFAVGPQGEFGLGHKLPWGNCKADLMRFRALTITYDALIVGHTTFKHLGPLESRKMIVVASNHVELNASETRPNVVYADPDTALAYPGKKIVIGGAKLLEYYWDKIDRIYRSIILYPSGVTKWPNMTAFNPVYSGFKEIHHEAWADHYFSIYERQLEAQSESELLAKLDRAYSERAACAVALARSIVAIGGNAGISIDQSASSGWDKTVMVDTPNGQVSWHIAPHDQHLLAGLPMYNGKWDGTFKSRELENNWAVWTIALGTPGFTGIFAHLKSKEESAAKLKETK